MFISTPFGAERIRPLQNLSFKLSKYIQVNSDGTELAAKELPVKTRGNGDGSSEKSKF